MIYISYTENLVYVYLNTYKDYYTEMFLFFKILDYCMFCTHTHAIIVLEYRAEQRKTSLLNRIN